MELPLILERLQMTIDKLKTLKPEQFNYSMFIEKFDQKTSCGTVCCVAGWYPLWFPLSTLVYRKIDNGLVLKLSSDTFYDIEYALSSYHGISEDLVNCLFFGMHIDSLTNEFRGKCLLNKVSLSEVINRFEAMYKCLESGSISHDFQVL